jgi:hypothetical protein
MVIFYDPLDSLEQQRIESVLRSGGVEYCLRDGPEAALRSSQILVAEEDVPTAEKLLSSRGRQ